MAANTVPIHPKTPNTFRGVTSGTANANYAQAPTASSTSYGNNAAADGDRVRGVSWLVQTPNASGGKVQFWHKTAGAVSTLIGEMAYAAGTASATVLAQSGVWVPPSGFDFLLSGESIGVSCSQTDVVTFCVRQDSY